MIEKTYLGRTLTILALNAFYYEHMDGIESFSPSRSIIQTILYEIYFKPDGGSFEDSGLLHIAHDKPFMGPWTLNDHIDATIQIGMWQ